MKITVRYSAQIRSVAGAAAEELELADGAGAAEAVRAVVARHGEPMRRLLLTAQGKVQPTLLLFAGDEQLRASVPRPLCDGQELSILTPIAGG